MTDPSRRSLVAAIVAGLGFSGVLDVLVLHHVLQLHHLVSARVDPGTVSGLRTNVLADGLFTLAMLGIMLVGLGWVWRVDRRTASPLSLAPLSSAGLVGIGLFDLIDVLVNHYLLGLHHATHGGAFRDPQWVVISVAFTAAGLVLLWSR